MSYDFSTLNDKEFEQLCADLLSAELRVRVERFRSGRDLGVDGRWFAADSGEVLIQCKHWLRSGFSKLLQRIETDEAPKVRRLGPKRYLLLTSLSLTRQNKAALQLALAPYVLSPADIFGQEDLNDLLARHPEVERRHYKLWLSSTTVLRSLLNNAIIGRSAALLEEFREEASIYAVTSDHEIARRKLLAESILLLTGEPGIGKTTLARQLALEQVANGYELIAIEESLSEAEAVYDNSRKQLFYFDDFLGRSYLETLRAKQDSHLVTFIKRIARDPDKRLILTSRTNILNQGQALSDILSEPPVSIAQYQMTVRALSTMDRAKILYNHVWFTTLSPSHVDALYSNLHYMAIIKHDNFNPRLVAFILDGVKMSGIPAESFWNRIQEILSRPAEVWSHFFTAQSSQEARDLTYLVTLNGRSISEPDLQSAFAETLAPNTTHKEAVAQAFMKALRHCLRATLIRTYRGPRTIANISLFNPSIADYVQSQFAGGSYWEYYFPIIRTTNALNQIEELKKAGVIDAATWRRILEACARRQMARPLEWDDYGLRLARILAEHPEFHHAFGSSLIEHWFADERPELRHSQLLDMLRLARTWKHFMTPVAARRYFATLSQEVAEMGLPLDEPELLSALSMALKETGAGEGFVLFRERLVEQWSDEIDEIVENEDILADYTDEDQERMARWDLERYVTDAFRDLGIELRSDEAELIVDSVDIDRHLRRNMAAAIEEAAAEDHYPARNTGGLGDDAQIRDLFDRE